MGSSEASMPALLSSPPLRQDSPSGCRACRKGAKRQQANGKVQCRDRVISIDELDCDPANIAAIFKEDLSERATARKFLWEFFD